MEKITGSMISPVFWKFCAMFPVPLGVGGTMVAAFPLAVHVNEGFSTWEVRATLAVVFEQMVRLEGVLITSGTG